MVDRVVVSATEQKDVAAAWKSLVSPKDRVGIKISAAGGRYFSTHRSVVDAIVAGLGQAGISPSQITIWDREESQLRAAGFAPTRSGFGVRGIAPGDGYDRDALIAAPVLGKLIWGDLLFREKQRRSLGKKPAEADQLSSNSYIATLLSRDVTKVINVPVLSDEAGCGLAGALFNMTVPNVDNWRRFVTQGDASAADSIPALYSDERIGGKVVLHIMDALVAQFAGGPNGNPNYAFTHATIYASKDPVALDATAFRLIEEWRKEAKLPSIAKRAAWLKTAAEMGLGNFDEAAIALKEVPAKP